MAGRWGNSVRQVVHRVRTRWHRRQRRATTSLTVRVWADELDGGYGAEVVELPGIVSQGETEQEALDNVVEAISEVVASIIIDEKAAARVPEIEGGHRHPVRIAVSA